MVINFLTSELVWFALGLPRMYTIMMETFADMAADGNEVVLILDQHMDWGN
jgi:hypothetical protein